MSDKVIQKQLIRLEAIKKKIENDKVSHGDNYFLIQKKVIEEIITKIGFIEGELGDLLKSG